MSVYTTSYSNDLSSRLSATEWEDEGTYCYQVEVRGISVARRKDNDMINGTKLLNVAGMTRGKRDGILKNESGRVVVKSGSMALKGVWLPIDRAIELAKDHAILDSLYPLFESTIDNFYYSPYPIPYSTLDYNTMNSHHPHSIPLPSAVSLEPFYYSPEPYCPPAPSHYPSYPSPSLPPISPFPTAYPPSHHHPTTAPLHHFYPLPYPTS